MLIVKSAAVSKEQRARKMPNDRTKRLQTAHKDQRERHARSNDRCVLDGVENTRGGTCLVRRMGERQRGTERR